MSAGVSDLGGSLAEGVALVQVREETGLFGLPVQQCAALGQWPKVNQLTFTKSAGWPLVKVR